MARLRKDKLASKWERIARVFSKNYGVKVILSGRDCITDPDEGVIYIPANADYLSDADQQVLEGMLDHEWKHVEEEVKAKEARAAGEVVQLPSEAMAACFSRRERILLNAYEDVRIERDAARRFPGVAENLRSFHEHTIERYRANPPGDKADPWWLIAVSIIAHCHEQPTDWLPAPINLLVQTKLADLIEAGRNTTSVSDCLSLARQTIKRITDAAEEARRERERREEERREEEQEEEREEAEEGAEGEEARSKGRRDEGSGADDEPEGGDADEDGEGGGDGKEEQEGGESGDNAGMSAEGEGDEGAEEEGASGAGASGGADGEGEGKGGAGGEGGSGDGSADGESADGERVGGAADPIRDLGDAELDEFIEVIGSAAGADADTSDICEHVKREIADAAGADMDAHRRWNPHPAVLRMDRWIKHRTDAHHETRYRHAKSRVMPKVSGLKSRILSAMRARSLSHFTGDKERGDVDSAALYGLRTGNKNVFATKVKGQPVDTAVTIFVDESGSMNVANRITRAREVVLALAETFDAVGIPFEIIGFTNTHARGVSPHGGHTRFLAFDFNVVKEFTESYKRVKARVMTLSAREENVDGEALLHVARRIASRPEARKIIFALSDGAPLGGGTHLEEHLTETVKRVTASGIEVYGVGIQTRAVARFYSPANGSDFIVVDALEQLPSQVFKLLRKKMVGGGR